ncbi:oxysterol-binding related protein [Cyclospora cayetanensis]|uniref:Oxysterol-binding related protein n=1 Tax=Cyclospora cayetanensis TaxID=88456 RepID=A0A1D3CT62_9EIME|nr:oxysterol-binding related protein [Cyclospora cayetanensis]
MVVGYVWLTNNKIINSLNCCPPLVAATFAYFVPAATAATALYTTVLDNFSSGYKQPTVLRYDAANSSGSSPFPVKGNISNKTALSRALVLSLHRGGANGLIATSIHNSCSKLHRVVASPSLPGVQQKEGQEQSYKGQKEEEEQHLKLDQTEEATMCVPGSIVKSGAQQKQPQHPQQEGEEQQSSAASPRHQQLVAAAAGGHTAVLPASASSGRHLQPESASGRQTEETTPDPAVEPLTGLPSPPPPPSATPAKQQQHPALCSCRDGFRSGPISSLHGGQDDPVRFEVDVVDQQTLFLRAESQEEKQMCGLAGVVASSAAAAAAFATSRLRSLSVATVQQQQQLPPPLEQPPPPPPPPPAQSPPTALQQQPPSEAARMASTETCVLRECAVVDSNAGSPLHTTHSSQEAESTSSLLDATSTEGPLVLLLESVISARQNIQARFEGGSQLRQDVVLLLQRVDELQQLLQQLLQQWEQLLSEEYTQRRQLEKSVRSLAKRTYKLDKVQGRLMQLSRQRSRLTAAEIAAIIAGRLLAMLRQLLMASMRVQILDDQAGTCIDVGASERRQKEEDGSFVTEAPASSSPSASGAESLNSSSRGSPFSASTNAPLTLAACNCPLGGLFPAQRLALPKPRTEFKVDTPYTLSSKRKPASKGTLEFAVNLWSVLKDCIGRDLSRIAMPVYFNEPTSFLQRQCEDLQYADLLNLASRFPRSVDRLLALTVFALSPYASAVGRTYKPFNPLLGETFELVHRGFRFLSEQVGHHPPITAYVANAPEFSCEGWMTVRNRFSGKSLEVLCVLPNPELALPLALLRDAIDVEVTMPGMARVMLHRTGERFSYKRIKMLVHNVIWGKLWIEVLDKTCHHVRAIIFDASGRPYYRLSGQWSTALYVEEAPPFNPHKSWKVPPQVDEFRRSETGPPADSPDNQLDAVISQYWESIPWIEASKRLIWRPAARPPNADQFYGFGYFTMELNELSQEYAAHAAPTDSRRRPDQRLYEEGSVDEAVQHKNRLEEKQRAVARMRPRGEADYTPMWFMRQPDSEEWVYKGGYWEARDSGNWSCCPDIF